MVTNAGPMLSCFGGELPWSLVDDQYARQSRFFGRIVPEHIMRLHVQNDRPEDRTLPRYDKERERFRLARQIKFVHPKPTQGGVGIASHKSGLYSREHSSLRPGSDRRAFFARLAPIGPARPVRDRGMPCRRRNSLLGERTRPSRPQHQGSPMPS